MKRTIDANINTVQYWDGRYAREVEAMWSIWTTHDLIEKVAAYIPLRARVLDAGCGAGIVPARISKIRSDIQWSGCDFSAESVRYLSNLGLVTFSEVFQGDLEQGLPCEDGQYDVALCTEVLEHLEQPEAAIRELARVAKDRVVITVPNERAIDSPEHVWSYTVQDVVQMLSPYGTVQTQYCRGGRNIIGVCLLSRSL